MFKKLWFKSHKIGIYITPYLWIISNYFLLVYLFIILSWKLNHNKCIISEIEYHLFGETFMGKGPKYFVPHKHRYILYINLIIGILYNKLNYN